MSDEILIRCPKCKWEPFENSLWECSCGMRWNTFSTAGRCPQCSKVWKDTQCPECHKWSPHLDWYYGLDEIISRLKESIRENWLQEEGR